MRLADKVAIITGAGGGMGRVASQMFAAEGAKIVVAEFGEAAGEETVRLVREAGGDATFVKTDVSNEASAKSMVDQAVSTYGRVDVLYNNAGIMPEADHSVIDTDVATWDQVMAVNVRVDHRVVGLRHDPGVVVEDIDAAVRRNRLIDHRLRRGLVRDVRLDERRIATGLADEPDGLLAGCLTELRHDDLRPLGGEHLACHAAHAPAGPGDDRNLVGQAHRILLIVRGGISGPPSFCGLPE